MLWTVNCKHMPVANSETAESRWSMWQLHKKRKKTAHYDTKHFTTM